MSAEWMGFGADEFRDLMNDQEMAPHLHAIMEYIAKQKKRGKRKGRHVLQRFPMRPEWRAKFEALDELEKQMEQFSKKAQSLHRQAWGKVEEDTGLYDDMTYKKDEQLIIVWGEGPTEGLEALKPEDIIGGAPPTPPTPPSEPPSSA